VAPKHAADGSVAAKNAIRGSIKGLFPDRDCATLVRPMHDEQASARSGVLHAGLRRRPTLPLAPQLTAPCTTARAREQALVSLDQLPVEALRPEFRQGVAALLRIILAKVRGGLLRLCGESALLAVLCPLLPLARPPPANLPSSTFRVSAYVPSTPRSPSRGPLAAWACCLGRCWPAWRRPT
jgi:hypothetical protein